VTRAIERNGGRAGALLAALVLVACKGASSGFPEDDASNPEQGGDDGSSQQSSGAGSSSGSIVGSSGAGSSSGSGNSSGGKSSSSGAAASSGGSESGTSCVPAASTPRVTSNVTFNDAGAISCGTYCELSNHVCCVNAVGDGTCLDAGSTCPSNGGLPQAQFECWQASDCPCGQICCGVANNETGSASAGSNCQDVSLTGGACTPVADAGAQSKAGSAQLCQTNAECKNGMACSWQICNVTTPYGPAMPNLTMCGLQSAAPFNCAEHN
jgi:hypothetical protein